MSTRRNPRCNVLRDDELLNYLEEIYDDKDVDEPDELQDSSDDYQPQVCFILFLYNLSCCDDMLLHLEMIWILNQTVTLIVNQMVHMIQIPLIM